MKQVALALCAALSWVVIGCGDNIEPDVVENCATAGDEDGNGMADCADPACASSCQPVCGNNKVETGEACDDGNAMDGDGCDNNCKPTGCGNGIVTGAETCDDGNDVSGDGCDNNCTMTACGNNIPTAGEECDDGNATNGDACDSNCTTPRCGNGATAPGEECDDANPNELDGCTPSCILEPTEIEPNEDGSPQTGGGPTAGNDFATANADANGELTRSINILAAITPLGDEDVFKFTNPTTTLQAVQFDTWRIASGINVACGSLIDTVIHIRNAAGTSLASNNDRRTTDPVDWCSRVTIALAAGESVYVHVIDYGDNTLVSGYALEATYRPLVCGDLIVDPGEECEDGNTTTGDGCDATCLYEASVEVEPNNTRAEAAANPIQITADTLIRGKIEPVGDIDMFRISLTAPTVVRFETLASLYDCNATTTLDIRLYDPFGTQLAADVEATGIGMCGALVYYLDAGVHYVSVEERGNNALLASYFFQIDLQGDRAFEAEPSNTTGGNDTIATAAGNLLAGGDVFVYGDHLQANDVDVYALTVPAGARIRAEVIEGDRLSETCESEGIDSRLTLFNEAGVQIADDDDLGRGFCSLIDGTGTSATPLHRNARNGTSTPQTFYLMVRRSTLAAGAQQTFVYRAQVSYR